MKNIPKPTLFKGASEMPYCTVSLTDMSWNNTGTWRYLRPGYIEQIPACQSACPAAEPIERWLAHLETGDIKKAWETLITENPFPGLMGRVCFHPCERSCNRKDVGGAVTINMLERFLADKHGYENTSVKPWRSPSGKKIAIVGAGPAGLSCAYFSARLGHSVTVFDNFPKPGGLFRYGIPEYRLPKAILENELKKLYELGIKFECGKMLSKEEITDLAKSHDALLLSTGAHISRPLAVEGEKTGGVMPALTFLENAQLNLENKRDVKFEARDTVVVGGGNSAVDAAREALRLGSKSVTILYRRSKVEMPAFDEEVSEAVKEGVKLEVLAAPVKIDSQNGRVSGLQCRRMKLGDPDASGRRTPIPIQGSEFSLNADLVLMAIGEIADEETGAITGDKIYRAGDLLDTTRTVVNAVGSGKLSAIQMDCAFSKKDFNKILEQIAIPNTDYVKMALYLEAGDANIKKTIVRTDSLNTYYFDDSKPAPYPQMGPAVAQTQIERCMHCGHCTQCDNCFIYCPDVAIKKKTGGYDIDFNYCKGCGVCVKECPRAAMEMTEEPA